MTIKNMIGVLSINEKLNDTNYDMWYRKIQYLLNEREVLETLSTTMVEPTNTSSEKYKEEIAAYQEWSKKDSSARYTMLYCMHDDLMGNLRIVPRLRTYGTSLRSRMVKHLQQGCVP